MQARNMFKKLVIAMALSGAIFEIHAAPVSRVTNFSDGQVLTASQLNSEFNNLISGGINSINNANIADSAAIVPSKLSATIKGDAIERDGTTGALSVKVDDVSIEIDADNLAVKDDGIVTAKIDDEAVTTAKIDDGAVTQAKRAALGQQISASSGSFSSSSAFDVDVTNLTVTITTTGRPIYLGLTSGVGGTGSYMRVFDTDAADALATVSFIEGASTLKFNGNIGGRTATGSATDDPIFYLPCSAFNTVLVLAAGTYTFKTTVDIGSGDTIDVTDCTMVAYEL
jgi:hypothetical protein